MNFDHQIFYRFYSSHCCLSSPVLGRQVIIIFISSKILSMQFLGNSRLSQSQNNIKHRRRKIKHSLFLLPNKLLLLIVLVNIRPTSGQHSGRSLKDIYRKISVFYLNWLENCILFFKSGSKFMESAANHW